MADYEYWTKALADPKALHAREFVITTEPQLGFFRTKYGRPVAIWEDAGEIVAAVGIEDPEPCSDELWTRVAKYPVTEDEYHRVTGGEEWSDRDAVIRATLGDNLKDTTDREALSDMIFLLVGESGKYAKITDDGMAQRAISIRNRLNELKNRADYLRKEEKQPHLDAGNAVDVEWMPMVKHAEQSGKNLAKAASVYESAKLAQENALRAERERLDREAKAKADAFGLPPVEPTPEPAPAPVNDQIRSGYGKAASIKRKLVVVRIDVRVVAAQYADNPKLIDLLTSLAQKSVDDGHEVPGATTEMQAIVR